MGEPTLSYEPACPAPHGMPPGAPLDSAPEMTQPQDDGVPAPWRRWAGGSIAAAALAIVVALSSPGGAQAPSWQFPAPEASAASEAPTATLDAPSSQLPVVPQPSGLASQPPVEGDIGDDGDEGLDPSFTYLSPDDGRIQVYPDQPSVLPGQKLVLHTSTNARSYAISVTREGASPAIVYRRSGIAGHDYRARRTIDAVMHTVRANWPATISIPTTGWRPGVYTVDAVDSIGRSSGTVFVVRTPVASRSAALFVLPVMDYEAYNDWGGASFYTKLRAYQVSFDRPYRQDGGFGMFPAYDRRILVWLQSHGYPLAYTTDYDLSMRPPAAAPRVLVLPQHTEYVPASLFNWVDQHVNAVGDMNVAVLGANSFYWQTRLVAGPHGNARPWDVLSYKNCAADPLAAATPALATCLWRSSVVDRPETSLFGSMYSGIVDGGHTRHDAVITAAAPTWALYGTGWRRGTRLSGLLLGEADNASTAAGGVAISTGTAPYLTTGTTLTGTMTVRTSPAGGRVFDAGTFIFGAVLDGHYSVGVTHASFDRFTRNVMAWLGVKATR